MSDQFNALHPDCPDMRRFGPTVGDAALRLHAENVRQTLTEQKEGWAGGFTRRRFLASAGAAVATAALGAQYVTSKAAFAAPGSSNGNVLVVVFLRGGCDGLHLLIPASEQLGGGELKKARPSLAVPPDKQIALVNGWAMNKAMAPLEPFWKSKEVAFIPAVATKEVSRSHFQAQDYYEVGGPPSQLRTGWLDRVLTKLGPGTTFRAVSEGSTQPRSMAGTEPKLVVNGIKNFKFPGWEGVREQSKTALMELYRGIDHPLTHQVGATISALNEAEKIAAGDDTPANGAEYGKGGFHDAMRDVARLVKADVGLQVATVDVGGFDTHTNEAGDLERHATSFSQAMAAFLTDLGPELRKKVTVVTMTEFGRRVGQNANNGTDHGHGAVMMMFGGGFSGGAVHGKWQGLAPSALDNGDVPGLNNAFDVFGEVVQKRLGIGDLGDVFPGHTYAPLNVARAS